MSEITQEGEPQMNALTQSNVNVPARIAMPATAKAMGVSSGDWSVLVDAIYPNARSAESVVLALSYCRARKLDPMKRPVHIVPMWNSQAGRYVETVWPGISELQTTAHRTAQYAGMDMPEWGPDITRTFEGKVKDDGKWVDMKITLTIPEWCAVTVYRIMHGQRMPFSEPVYWLEAYARRGKAEIPNDMWSKRVRGQLHKCAKAAALRAAFPEELGNEYTAEEMEGREINVRPDDGLAIAKEDAIADGRAIRVKRATVTGRDKLLATKDAACDALAEALQRCQSRADLERLLDDNVEIADSIPKDGASEAQQRLRETIDSLRATVFDAEPEPEYDPDTGEIADEPLAISDAELKAAAGRAADMLKAARSDADVAHALTGDWFGALRERAPGMHGRLIALADAARERMSGAAA